MSEENWDGHRLFGLEYADRANVKAEELAGAAVTAPADEKSTQAENESICSELLGWERVVISAIVAYWIIPGAKERSSYTPNFTDWQGAGLILEALYAKSIRVSIDLYVTGMWRVRIAPWTETSDIPDCATGPLAIRAAALSYLRSLER